MKKEAKTKDESKKVKERKEKIKGITIKEESDFSSWYTQVVQKSEFVDYSEVSGCIVFKPLGYSVWEKTKEVLDSKFKEVGVKNVYFPLFIPESALKKEAEHVKGFSPEVAWVTEVGNTKLVERLAIRPTSETIMYSSFSKWIRSYRDLPLKLNQWNNVVRWEFKHPILLLRSREFLWNEGHSVFASRKEAEQEKDKIIKIYSDFVKDYMALHFVVGRKTEKEKFAGAEYSIALELFLPNGKAIQGPDFHFDGQNFAKAFDIQFLNKDGKKEYVWQNTFAISTRMLGVMIAIHSDNKGLILPPKLAPNKIVIIPILFKESEKEVLKKAEEIKKLLKDFNPILDNREYNPGYKFNEGEIKGIPIRIEIGPKDIEKKQVVLVRRDTGKKEIVKTTDIIKKVNLILEDIQKNLFNKSKKFLENNIVKIKTFTEFNKALENKKMILAPFCNRTSCEDLIKDKTTASSRVIPFNQPRLSSRDKCFFCNNKAKVFCYFGKSY